jgi:hypothetical protein
MTTANTTEEFTISGAEDVVSAIGKIIDEGNARRIIIKNEAGNSIIEIPLAVGAIGILLAPTLAAVGAVAALVAKCTIIVEKRI